MGVYGWGGEYEWGVGNMNGEWRIWMEQPIWMRLLMTDKDAGRGGGGGYRSGVRDMAYFLKWWK